MSSIVKNVDFPKTSPCFFLLLSKLPFTRSFLVYLTQRTVDDSPSSKSSKVVENERDDFGKNSPTNELEALKTK